jgi:hypothetical protein
VPVVHAAQIQGDVKQDDFSAHLRKVLFTAAARITLGLL